MPSKTPFPDRWKKNPGRLKDFLRRALKTRASQNAIARRAGVPPLRVYKVNQRHSVRTAEQSREIRRAALVRFQNRNRKKRNLFSEDEKKELIDSTKKSIGVKLRSFWGYAWIRKEFGSFQQFMNDAIAYLNEQLDYYAPAIKGKTGQSMSPRNFLLTYTQFFAQQQSREIGKRMERSRGFNAVEENSVTEETNARRVQSRLSAMAVEAKLANYPRSLRALLRNWGIPKETIVQIPLEKLQKQLSAVVAEAYLSDVQKQVLSLRIEGIAFKDIAKRILVQGRQVSPAAIINIQKAAIIRLKEQKRTITSEF